MAGFLLAGCTGNHSALNPASDEASLIAALWWVMLGGATLILVVVLALLLTGIMRGRGKQAHALDENESRRLVLAGGVVIPLFVLFFLVAGSVWVGKKVVSQAAETPSEALTIEVIGRRWWWEVHYLDQDGRRIATTANEIHVPVGRPVRFLLKSTNVIHSFWVPNLQGKVDMIPGQVNTVAFEARQAGVYKGQCAEFCGIQHTKMQFLVVAQDEAQFQAWIAQQALPAQEPTDPMLRHGRRVFFSSACIRCHAVRDASSINNIGPDLTHVGSRGTLAAAAIPNTPGHMGGWILAPQSIKPGNLMPPTALAPEDLRALVDYLQSLK